MVTRYKRIILRYIETILIALTFLMLIFKKAHFPFAGIGFGLLMVLLAIFYLTSKIHIFSNKEFRNGTTTVSILILFVSIIFLLLLYSNWIELTKPLFAILAIQVLWFSYLILKRKKTKNALSIRIGMLIIIFGFTLFAYSG